MTAGKAKRILVVSSPRSGSTWVMRALACAPETAFVHEPDNVDTAAQVEGSVTRLGFGPYPVLEPSDQAAQYAALWDLAFQGRRALRFRHGWGRTLARAAFRLPRRLRDPLLAATVRGMGRVAAQPRHVVVSSVMAHFAAEWIHHRFQPQVVLLERDPLNIASSWLRLQVGAYDIHRRAAIVERHLRPLGVEPPPPGLSDVGLVGWWVGALAAQLRHLADSHPDWIVISHEALCEDAEGQFRQLFGMLGLGWTAEAEQYLREGGYIAPLFMGGSNTFTAATDGTAADARAVQRQQARAWQERLTDDQVRELRDVLAAFPHRGFVRAQVAE